MARHAGPSRWWNQRVLCSEFETMKLRQLFFEKKSPKKKGIFFNAQVCRVSPLFGLNKKLWRGGAWWIVQIGWAKRWDLGIRICHMHMGMAMLLCVENPYKFELYSYNTWCIHIDTECPMSLFGMTMFHFRWLIIKKHFVRVSFCLARFGEGMGTDLSITRLQTQQQLATIHRFMLSGLRQGIQFFISF